ncbi:MAG: FAD-dependent monooxygenase, partial [Bacteriovorax sp.]|nr:FAD-dependent monooxygenase [Rhizobacter sp.]
MRTEFDAVIVGAGPSGSAAAILLARAGWAVALVEKQAFPRRKVCGECIAASNLPLLHALG